MVSSVGLRPFRSGMLGSWVVVLLRGAWQLMLMVLILMVSLLSRRLALALKRTWGMWLVMVLRVRCDYGVMCLVQLVR